MEKGGLVDVLLLPEGKEKKKSHLRWYALQHLWRGSVSSHKKGSLLQMIATVFKKHNIPGYFRNPSQGDKPIEILRTI